MIRPRVTARHERAASTLTDLGRRMTYTQPGVLVEVAFDLHDHERALVALEAAVADVRAQIGETS